MKRKLIATVLAGSLCLSLAACGSSETASSETGSSETVSSSEISSAASEAEETSAVESEAEESAAAESTGEIMEIAEGSAEGKVFGIIPRSAGNPYIAKETEGIQAVIEEMGGTCIVNYPKEATAEDQISSIQSMISQGVDCIAIAGNDENALQAALQEAMDAGIKVLSLDATVNPDSRMVHINQAGITVIGETLMEAVYDIAGGEGQWAVLSATSQSPNQNAWIEAMKTTAASDSKYDNLELVEIAYGDDETQKSTDQAQALLEKYPDLKVICSPTTVGIAATAKVLQDKGSSVKLTGLGQPSEMKEYVGDGDEYSCPYMFLWNPIDLGRLTGYAAIALTNDMITGAVGESFIAEGTTYTITEAEDGGTEIILGPPFRFDSSNIEEWAEVY